jgi:hypothetical protein
LPEERSNGCFFLQRAYPYDKINYEPRTGASCQALTARESVPDHLRGIGWDFGVFVSRDYGLDWQMLGDDLPNVPVTDLDFHQPTRKIIAVTYGRSMYSFDLDQLVLAEENDATEFEVTVFPNPARTVDSLQAPAGMYKLKFLTMMAKWLEGKRCYHRV